MSLSTLFLISWAYLATLCEEKREKKLRDLDCSRLRRLTRGDPSSSSSSRWSCRSLAPRPEMSNFQFRKLQRPWQGGWSLLKAIFPEKSLARSTTTSTFDCPRADQADQSAIGIKKNRRKKKVFFLLEGWSRGTPGLAFESRDFDHSPQRKENKRELVLSSGA